MYKNIADICIAGVVNNKKNQFKNMIPKWLPSPIRAALKATFAQKLFIALMSYLWFPNLFTTGLFAKFGAWLEKLGWGKKVENPQYLMKDIQDTALENYKNRLDNDIHKFSMVPNLTDEKFAGNVSGESLKYKLMGIDNLTSVKEAKFRKGLMRRIELICNYLRTTESSLQFDFVDIEPVFTRNRPVNELEIAQMMQTLTGILSEETIIGMHPAIADPQSELKKKQDENESVFEQPYEMQQEGNNEVGG